MQIALQANLNRLQQGENTWDVEFNSSKCIVLNNARSKHPYTSIYKLHGQAPTTVSGAKILGVNSLLTLTGINT